MPCRWLSKITLNRKRLSGPRVNRADLSMPSVSAKTLRKPMGSGSSLATLWSHGIPRNASNSVLLWHRKTRSLLLKKRRSASPRRNPRNRRVLTFIRRQLTSKRQSRLLRISLRSLLKYKVSKFIRTLGLCTCKLPSSNVNVLAAQAFSQLLANF